MKAFTLIETAIVIAVIGLLVAIAYPSLANAKKRSDIAAAEAMCKTLNDAITRARLASKTDDGSGDGTVNGVMSANVAPELYSDDPAVIIEYLYRNGYLQVK